MDTYLLKWDSDEECFKLVLNSEDSDEELDMTVKEDGDKYYDQDWVYVKNGKVLHVDGTLTEIYGEIFYKTAFDVYRPGWDVLNFDAEKLYDESFKNPVLLNEKEDAEFVKKENRLARAEKENERFTEEDLDELADLLQEGRKLEDIINERLDDLK